MKFQKLSLAAGLALACTLAAPLATASIYGPGEGYYYIAYTMTGGFPSSAQYMSVGPFADQNECNLARNADYGNGDAWLPFDGSGIHCTWVFHNEVGALEDTLEHWNTVVGGGNTRPGYLDVAKLERIAELREIHQVDRYEAAMVEVLDARR
jgi:hypothetical protein